MTRDRRREAIGLDEAPATSAGGDETGRRRRADRRVETECERAGVATVFPVSGPLHGGRAVRMSDRRRRRATLEWEVAARVTERNSTQHCMADGPRVL